MKMRLENEDEDEAQRRLLRRRLPDERSKTKTKMRLEDACYDAVHWMRATQRRAHCYCRDAGGQLINPISAHVERHFTAFFSNL